MTNDKLSRNKTIKLPRKVQNEGGTANTIEDLFSVRQGSATGFDVKFNSEKERAKADQIDCELDQISKISPESSDLLVITRTKKLGAYIFAITIKTPQKFRSIYIRRLHDLCIDALDCMYHANAIKQDSPANKQRREQYQTDAIIKLKLLGYMALLAENAACILLRQYKQISILLGDAINLCAAWRKSDNEKWEAKNK